MLPKTSLSERRAKSAAISLRARFHLFGSFSLLLLLFWALNPMPVKGQEENVIKLSVNLSENSGSDDDDISPFSPAFGEGEEMTAQIKLELTGDGKITIEGVKEPYSSETSSYTAISENVVIKGNVTSFSCAFDSKIKSIEAEGHTALKNASIRYSNVESINLKACKALSSFEGNSSSIAELDMTDCESLETVECGGIIKLTVAKFDGCAKLKSVNLSNCQIGTLNFAGHTALEKIECQGNDLLQVDVSGCSGLINLDCSKNSKMKALNLQGCIALKELNVHSSSSLEKLDLSSCKSLVFLMISNSGLSSLDVSGFSLMEQLYCEKNNLTSLNVSGCSALKLLSLHLNKLSMEVTSKIASDLPQRGDGDGAKIFAVGEHSDFTEENKWSKATVAKMKAKGWTVQKRKEYETEDYEGEAVNYAVTLVQGENGKITIKGYDEAALASIEEGTELEVEVEATEGYRLWSLTANEVDIMASKKFILNAPTIVKAVFEKAVFAVSVESEKGGKVEIKGEAGLDLNAVPFGTDLTVVVTLDENYELESLKANDKDISKEKKFTVKEDTKVVAKFRDITSSAFLSTSTIHIYPNPAQDYLYAISMPNTEVRLLSLGGRVLLSSHTDSEGVLCLDISGLPADTYLLQAGKSVQKVIIK